MNTLKSDGMETRPLFKNIVLTLSLVICLSMFSNAQSPIGSWKKISHLATYQGDTFDSHKALLTQRPCASGIIYRITADGNYRLDASASGCDADYVNIQQKLYAKNKWKMEGDRISLSATGFAVSQTYTVTFSGNKMTWKSEYGDVITYQRL